MVSIKNKVSRKKNVNKTRHEKTEAILRYLAATAIVFGVVTFSQRSIAVDAIDTSRDTFAGDTVRCAIAIGDNMYSKELMTGFNYELLEKFAGTDNCSMTIVPASADA